MLEIERSSLLPRLRVGTPGSLINPLLQSLTPGEHSSGQTPALRLGTKMLQPAGSHVMSVAEFSIFQHVGWPGRRQRRTWSSLFGQAGESPFRTQVQYDFPM